MAELEWHKPGENRWESGLDRGVLYPPTGPGVPWNGLINVEEAFSGGELSSYFHDGVKFLDMVANSNFQATLEAHTYPDEFEGLQGTVVVVPGLLATNQRPIPFGLSYRTGIGNDLDGEDHGYQLHLVYNATVSPNSKSRRTRSQEISLTNFQWTIDTVPPPTGLFRPTGHLVLDSRSLDPDVLSSLEGILYGSDSAEPRLPYPDELVSFIVAYSPLIVVPHISGVADLTSGMGDLTYTDTDGIYQTIPNTRLTETSTDGLYELEE